MYGSFTYWLKFRKSDLLKRVLSLLFVPLVIGYIIIAPEPLVSIKQVGRGPFDFGQPRVLYAGSAVKLQCSAPIIIGVYGDGVFISAEESGEYFNYALPYSQIYKITVKEGTVRCVSSESVTLKVDFGDFEIVIRVLLSVLLLIFLWGMWRD